MDRQRGLRWARNSLGEPGQTGLGFPDRHDTADPPDVRPPPPHPLPAHLIAMRPGPALGFPV